MIIFWSLANVEYLLVIWIYYKNNKCSNAIKHYLNWINLIIMVPFLSYQVHYCVGGVWWDTRRSYKNAVTNELFIELGMKLYE